MFFCHISDLLVNAMGCAHILVQFAIYRRLRIGREGHLDQYKAYDIS